MEPATINELVLIIKLEPLYVNLDPSNNKPTFELMQRTNTIPGQCEYFSNLICRNICNPYKNIDAMQIPQHIIR